MKEASCERTHVNVNLISALFDSLIMNGIPMEICYITSRLCSGNVLQPLPTVTNLHFIQLILS